ncbi:substrate-binding domain-containing protein [Pseudonocardia humida]|uniref:Substrate-binding domain-containing protein n=1 Tax=Pseudonocardia humida TaxID=2800819 RepID=A0ABT0ZSB7_9PSEU|nr:substrate-binding domain-containing protein [Pseudonocardia humida]MCO1653621.1 substrate-binding domain-containing protein [Pseudonocardia humida]
MSWDAPRPAGRRGIAAVALAVSLAACSQAAPTPDAAAALAADSPIIAFLMPDQASTRYERYDYPLFQSRVDNLCVRCDVIYSNAEASADKQREQAMAALDRGAGVLVISAVDPAVAADIVRQAHDRGTKVVAYDRPIVDEPADRYISYDNEAIGRLITESLLDRLEGAPAGGGLLQVNGAPEDAAADLVQQGIAAALEDSAIPVLASYDTPGWDPDKAEAWVREQIDRFGPQIIGVIAGNDGTAGGAAAAFRAAGVSPVPPITGNDSELAAAQRILQGQQFNTISKPIKMVAEGAAATAVQIVNGGEPRAGEMLFGTPTELYEPTIVTAANLRSALIDTGELELGTVCTPELLDACERAGIER